MPTAGVCSNINSIWRKTQGDTFKEFSRSAVWSLCWLHLYTNSLMYLLLVPQFRTVPLPCEDI